MLDTTIGLPLILTAVTAALGAVITSVSTVVWMRISIILIKRVLYSENGDVRLMSFAAHERICSECQKSITSDRDHLKEIIKITETGQTKREEIFIEEMKKLSDKIEVLSECVTKLSVGIKC